MARAPLSRDELEVEANLIYVGRIAAVRVGDEEAEADLEVTSAEKTMLGADERLTIHYRLPGADGQHSPLAEGETVRVFLTVDAEGSAHLVEPNGWEPAG